MALFLKPINNSESSNDEGLICVNSRLKVGRRPECDLQVIDTVVSGNHCILEYIDNYIHVKDVSTNGTFINGEPVVEDTHDILRVNDILSLARPTFNEVTGENEHVASFIVVEKEGEDKGKEEDNTQLDKTQLDKTNKRKCDESDDISHPSAFVDNNNNTMRRKTTLLNKTQQDLNEKIAEIEALNETIEIKDLEIKQLKNKSVKLSQENLDLKTTIVTAEERIENLENSQVVSDDLYQELNKFYTILKNTFERKENHNHTVNLCDTRVGKLHDNSDFASADIF